MLEIRLDNKESIRLSRKKLLVLPAGSQANNFANNDNDIILVIAGVDRNLNIEINRATILIVEAGVRTTINTTGTQTINSQVVFIAGVSNKVIGITKQNKGQIFNMRDEQFDLSAISDFEQITIK